jgi:alpha-glucosidase (family GH31 glycosyl hydrolase)
MHDADFPVDIQWTDIDTMDSHLDFTYDNKTFHGLPELVRTMKAEGKHYVNILDPGISSTQPPGTYPPYDEGLKLGIFITKYNSTEPIVGEVTMHDHLCWKSCPSFLFCIGLAWSYCFS